MGRRIGSFSIQRRVARCTDSLSGISVPVGDAGIDCVMRMRLGPGADHPMLMTHPEGEYLKGLWLQAA